jgi:hypothetical protein
MVFNEPPSAAISKMRRTTADSFAFTRSLTPPPLSATFSYLRHNSGNNAWLLNGL